MILMLNWISDWLTYWATKLLPDWQAQQLSNWLGDWLNQAIYWLTDLPHDWQTDKSILLIISDYKLTDWVSNRLTNWGSTTPDKTCWDKSWKCLIFPVIPAKTETSTKWMPDFPPSPYPKLFRIAWQLYTLDFRPRQLWIVGGEGVYFLCLGQTGVGRKS